MQGDTETKPFLAPAVVIDGIARLINEHPFPALPLLPFFLEHILPLLSSSSSSPRILSSLFSRLFIAHSLPHKSLELFRFSLLHSRGSLSDSCLPVLLQSLSRSPGLIPFPSSAFHVLELARRAAPSLLTPSALSALLSPLARRSPDPFSSALSAFSRAELIWSAACRPPFAAPELTALLLSFCSCGRLPEARAAFHRLHSRLPPDSHSFNTLLLGFRTARHLPSFDLFFHDLLLRGFRPDAVSFNIRIDAYCKHARFSDALRLLDEMDAHRIPPTVRTLTTLVHGAGLSRDPSAARRLFDEMPKRGLLPDRPSYNALIGAFVRSGDCAGALRVLGDMELKGINADDVSYYTMLRGYISQVDLDGVLAIFQKIVADGFIPRTRTVMLLMKFFRSKGRLDLGLQLWEYLMEKGCCPHRHALDILAKELCFNDRAGEVYECFRRVVERGRLPSAKAIRLLEECLVKACDGEKLDGFREMITRLKILIPNAS